MVAPYCLNSPRSPKSNYSRVDYLASHTWTLLRQILSLPITSVLQISKNVSVTLAIGSYRKYTTSDNSKTSLTWNSSQTSYHPRALASLVSSRMSCQVCLSGMKRRAITTLTSILITLKLTTRCTLTSRMQSRASIATSWPNELWLG